MFPRRPHDRLQARTRSTPFAVVPALDEDERAMFRRLGIFAAGFDLNAAVAVAPAVSRGMIADLIGRLTDKSLLTIDARFERACTLTLMDGRAGEGHAELAALGCRPPA